MSTTGPKRVGYLNIYSPNAIRKPSWGVNANDSADGNRGTDKSSSPGEREADECPGNAFRQIFSFWDKLPEG